MRRSCGAHRAKRPRYVRARLAARFDITFVGTNPYPPYKTHHGRSDSLQSPTAYLRDPYNEDRGRGPRTKPAQTPRADTRGSRRIGRAPSTSLLARLIYTRFTVILSYSRVVMTATGVKGDLEGRPSSLARTLAHAYTYYHSLFLFLSPGSFRPSRALLFATGVSLARGLRTVANYTISNSARLSHRRDIRFLQLSCRTLPSQPIVYLTVVFTYMILNFAVHKM